MLVKDMLKQSLPLLLLCGLGGIIAGNTLGLMRSLFESIPGLIVVVPGIIALRGSISTAFGSRLGSAYHLGVIDADNLWNEELKQNILGSFFLSIFMSLVIGVLAYFSSFLLGVQPDVLKLMTVVMLAGVLSALILTSLTVSIVYLVFKRGLDPDNITGPALTTFGDIVTMVCIFGSGLLVEVGL
ncbi:MAG: magnesium transporter [Candidatus Thermoplasmatota archaeon]